MLQRRLAGLATFAHALNTTPKKSQELQMSDPNSAQADYWNSESGYQWIALETFLDAALASILDRLMERVDIRRGV